MYQKCVMHVQNCCFTNLKLNIALLPFFLTSPSSLCQMERLSDSPVVYCRSCHVAGHLWIAFLQYKIRCAVPTVHDMPKSTFYGY